jgi:hypothetical protein
MHGLHPEIARALSRIFCLAGKLAALPTITSFDEMNEAGQRR